MERNRELAKNTVVFAIGTFGAKIIKFLLVPMYTIYMSTSEFGTADLMTSSVSLVMPLLTAGFTSGALRFMIGQPKNKQSVLKSSALVCAIATALSMALIPLLMLVPNFSGLELFFPFLVFATSAYHLLAQYCKGIECNKFYAIGGILSALTLSLLSLLMLGVFRLGIRGYLIAFIASDLITAIFYALVCKVAKTLKEAKINWVLTKEIILYAIPLIPNEIAWWIIQVSDRYMLIYLVGSTINGVYSMAYKIPGLFNLVVSTFIQAFNIASFKECDSKLDSSGKMNGEFFEKTYRIYSSLTYLAATVVILATKPVAMFVLKNDFFESWKFTPLLLIAFAVGNLQSFYGSILSGIKKTKILFLSTLFGAIVNILLNYVLINRYSAYGAAIATVTSYIVVYIIRALGTAKYVNMNHYIRYNVFSLILLIVVSITYIKMSIASLIVCAICSIIIVFIGRKEYVQIIKTAFNFAKRVYKRVTH